MPKSQPTWPVAKAKARLSTLIHRVLSDGPQIITKNGRKTVVVVAADEWARKTKPHGNLASFLTNSPLRAAGLRIKRSRDKARPILL